MGWLVLPWASRLEQAVANATEADNGLGTKYIQLAV